jgi:hypothetical protein
MCYLDGTAGGQVTERHSMIPSRLIIPLTALMFTCSMVLAQNPAADSAAAPRIELSNAQKRTIYESVTKTRRSL